MHQLTCSIVLYDNDVATLNRVIECVLRSNLKIKLFLVDNSESDKLKILADNSCIEYIFNNKNFGYGKAHNIALKKTVQVTPYHLVLNPDIEFKQGVLEEIYGFMQKHNTVGQLMPKVFYKNGDFQKLCHLLPAPVDLIGRRFLLNFKIVQQLNDRYELKGFDYNSCANIPNLSGCFMWLRTEALKKIGGFDARYFMYMEDIDLTRRMHMLGETIYYPHVNIIHGFEKESYSDPLLLRYHMSSAIKYFNKWGWLFDKQRTIINKKTLQALNLN